MLGGVRRHRAVRHGSAGTPRADPAVKIGVLPRPEPLNQEIPRPPRTGRTTAGPLVGGDRQRTVTGEGGVSAVRPGAAGAAEPDRVRIRGTRGDRQDFPRVLRAATAEPARP